MLKVHFFLATLLLGSLFSAYTWHHLARAEMILPIEGYELNIPPGTSFYKVSKKLQDDRVFTHPRLLRWYAAFFGLAHKIHAGEYLITYGSTPLQLLDTISNGYVRQYPFTVVEGQRVQDVVAALRREPKVQTVLGNLSPSEIISELHLPVENLEGLLWPDTYFFTAGTTDAEIIRRAYFNMQERLQLLWQDRDPDIKLADPYTALVLASIIEKESGNYVEHIEISGVYHRRLEKNMRLQADPTVIYALGDKLQGKLLKGHLSYASPYNTYLNKGLPPTPIAIPSESAIYAALHPAAGDTLYFVATTGGKHVFTSTLEQHNKAVAERRAKN